MAKPSFNAFDRFTNPPESVADLADNEQVAAADRTVDAPKSQHRDTTHWPSDPAAPTEPPPEDRIENEVPACSTRTAGSGASRLGEYCRQLDLSAELLLELSDDPSAPKAERGRALSAYEKISLFLGELKKRRVRMLRQDLAPSES